MKNLVSAEWLKVHAEENDLILLDASMKPPGESTEEKSSFSLPGARFFDIKGAFSKAEAPFPSTFPEAAQFEEEAQKLGIDKDSKIVVFDYKGIFSSARAWWMFKTMGHEAVAVLDGGLPEWQAKGFPTESLMDRSYPTGNFEAKLQPENVLCYADILKNTEDPDFVVVDARSQGRFEGTAEEPRKHLQSGHIPGSINIPYTSLLDGNCYKPKEELQAIFNEKLPEGKEFVFSCGSGISACIVLLALELVRPGSRKVYDGSWTEWAERQGLTK